MMDIENRRKILNDQKFFTPFYYLFNRWYVNSLKDVEGLNLQQRDALLTKIKWQTEIVEEINKELVYRGYQSYEELMCC